MKTLELQSFQSTDQERVLRKSNNNNNDTRGMGGWKHPKVA